MFSPPRMMRSRIRLSKKSRPPSITPKSPVWYHPLFVNRRLRRFRILPITEEHRWGTDMDLTYLARAESPSVGTADLDLVCRPRRAHRIGVLEHERSGGDGAQSARLGHPVPVREHHMGQALLEGPDECGGEDGPSRRRRLQRGEVACLEIRVLEDPPVVRRDGAPGPDPVALCHLEVPLLVPAARRREHHGGRGPRSAEERDGARDVEERADEQDNGPSRSEGVETTCAAPSAPLSALVCVAWMKFR